MKCSPRGALRTSVRAHGTDVAIEVADRGYGIPNGLEEQLRGSMHGEQRVFLPH